MTWCEYMNADWFKALQREIAASNITQVALKMIVDRATVSAIVNGLAAYGKGTAKTTNFEHKFRQAYEQLDCPYSGKQVGGAYCREQALCAAPTHNPLQMQHWQACQQCSHKPRPVVAVEPVIVKPIQKIGRVGPVTNEIYSHAGCLTQQAGIIDTVTLPLPEVGAPQIAVSTEEVTA